VRLLVSGARGQLGRELVRLGGGRELMAVSHEQLDITNADAVLRCCEAFRPDVVINAAAYTAVDRAETERAAAFAVNRDGVANLARACRRMGVPLIHVSTDYVFDGTKHGTYDEHDPVSPLGVYGASKLAGEEMVRQYASKLAILRTSWVFSAHGGNFVKTMLRLGADRQRLGIVADQHGCPTAASEMARAIYALVDAGLADWNNAVYHVCQPEPTTWHGFATAIFTAAQAMALKVTDVTAINTSDYPTPATRPQNSVLNCSKFEQRFHFTIRPWSESLREVIKELKHG